MSSPKIAITTGDPAGIGPELIVRAWSEPRLHVAGRLIVVGDPSILQQAIERHRVSVRMEVLSTVAEACPSPALLPCLPIACSRPSEVYLGHPNISSGEQAYQAIVKGTRLVLAQEADGLVTGPISKATLHAAGYPWPGHTELLAELCSVKHSAMMLYLPPDQTAAPGGLGIVHVTLHMPLRKALDAVTQPAILRAAQFVAGLMTRIRGHYGLSSQPRVGICALNPHAGEEGLFGDEEIRILAPAVRELQSSGYDAWGPLPADTLFGRAMRGEFDAVVAMYHDQGHIAVKLGHMFTAVNVTLGLPMVRTSVAHGTAFSIAGQGVADTRGLLAAVETCGVLLRSPAPADHRDVGGSLSNR